MLAGCMYNLPFGAWIVTTAGWIARARPYKPGMTATVAFLLDMDGTLLDTEPLHFEAHRRFLATVGIVPTEQDLVGNIGKGDGTFYRDLMARHGRSGDADAWVAAKTRVLIGIYRSGPVPVRPGTIEVLDHAAAHGITCVVVTSSERDLARVALEQSGLAPRLPIRICREDTVRHKPHPEPYLLAVTRLGLSPSGCLVVEDSASGVAAGRGAGCPVVAARGHVPDAVLLAAGASRVVDRLDGILPG